MNIVGGRLIYLPLSYPYNATHLDAAHCALPGSKLNLLNGFLGALAGGLFSEAAAAALAASLAAFLAAAAACWIAGSAG